MIREDEVCGTVEEVGMVTEERLELSWSPPEYYLQEFTLAANLRELRVSYA